MRFTAPRSPSVSPVRRHHTSRESSFRAPSDSSDSDYDSDGADSNSTSTASTSLSQSPFRSSRSGTASSPEKKDRPQHSRAELHQIQETLASIRLRANHHDAYEEWQRDTRQEAFRAARLEQSKAKLERSRMMQHSHAEAAQRHAQMAAEEMKRIQNVLNNISAKLRQEEEKFRAAWKERDDRVKARIEQAIKQEADAVEAQRAAEKKQREEEGRRREEELKQRMEEENRKKKEEEEKREEEEERKKKEEDVVAEKKRQEDAARVRKEREDALAQQRKSLGAATATEEWCFARNALRDLKTGPMKSVKGDKAMKPVWSAGRRAVTPKIGQLTNDPQSIQRITKQLLEIMNPKQAHPPIVYHALLSSLAKAILLQAETEVTAEKRSAIPLAQVTANLLCELAGFQEAFFAKLCQRAGGWPIPMTIPSTDSNGAPFDAVSKRKAMGYRGSADEPETQDQYAERVSGLMRLYFHVLLAQVPRPLIQFYRPTRFWTYFVRMLADPELLRNPVAPSVIHTALDVGGAAALSAFGPQWLKVLEQLYEGVTTGLPGTGELIGGKSPAGTAARVRVQLEVERIVRAFGAN
ncbi:hypothetical protein WOLCODRAFT_129083 [Wolfiporia cocos MD-104 SS10]|uniref:mRNA export factor GLE1 n=1 Tax=Wolfiporia cocos (strain MD-104) TaxID=742152 RepID=A0A2H3JR51_WOLCO|nr:hypothetical protein WOLCODRAFT_129083 [Wolfiporia cocos MD-104 SS10]